MIIFCSQEELKSHTTEVNKKHTFLRIGNVVNIKQTEEKGLIIFINNDISKNKYLIIKRNNFFAHWYSKEELSLSTDELENVRLKKWYKINKDKIIEKNREKVC